MTNSNIIFVAILQMRAHPGDTSLKSEFLEKVLTFYEGRDILPQHAAT